MSFIVHLGDLCVSILRSLHQSFFPDGGQLRVILKKKGKESPATKWKSFLVSSHEKSHQISSALMPTFIKVYTKDAKPLLLKFSPLFLSFLAEVKRDSSKTCKTSGHNTEKFYRWHSLKSSWSGQQTGFATPKEFNSSSLLPIQLDSQERHGYICNQQCFLLTCYDFLVPKLLAYLHQRHYYLLPSRWSFKYFF